MAFELGKDERFLVKLLKIAKKNGFENHFIEQIVLHKQEPFEISGLAVNNRCYPFPEYAEASINDLILNFEHNSTNFIEALFIEAEKLYPQAFAQIAAGKDAKEVSRTFRLGYISLPTSERLLYFFSCFTKFF